MPTKIRFNNFLFAAGFFLVTVGALVTAFGGTPLTAVAQTTSTVTFPIAELGNCADKDACRTYCNDQAHHDACTAFAQAHNFLPKQSPKPEQNQELLDAIKDGGPGNCTTLDACKTYCSDQANHDECKKFAEDNGLMPPPAQNDAVKKLIEALKQGIHTPGNCKTPDECKKVCANPDNATECRTFALKVGLLTKDGSQQLAKFEALVKAGKTPGGCDSPDACKAYCKDGAHLNECTDFMVSVGVLKPDEATKLKETGGAGPGGCRGEACREFCSKPENTQTCIDFARAHNLVPLEKLREIENEHKGNPPAGGLPPKLIECLRQVGGEELVTLVQSQGTKAIAPDLGEKIRTCFGVPGNGETSPAPSHLPIPSGCKLVQIACIKAPCPPQLICGSGVPVPSFSPRPVPSFSVKPLPSFPPGVSCHLRPACLDATPRCMIAEPAGGWCPSGIKLPLPIRPLPASGSGTVFDKLGGFLLELMNGPQ